MTRIEFLRLPRGLDRASMDGMREYYDRRAPEYDDWYEGVGRFADRPRPGWDEELRAVVRMVAGLSPTPVLAVACGTRSLTPPLPRPGSRPHPTPPLLLPP